jgi:serine/threonine-protein kinase
MENPEDLAGSTLGSYTLDRLLGQGGYAWVYEGHHSETGERCAVKVLKPRYSGDPQFENRFRNEVKVTAELDHPNIVQIREVSHEDRVTYFVMEYYPDSLSSVLERDTTVSEVVLHRIGMDISNALIAAHSADIIHRDIKTDNIMLRQDGAAVLSDFGIARALSGYNRATGANMTIGTPHYLSPEQAQGRKLDGRSDLYALGVTLYKAATGELPFKSNDWFELARMHVEDTPELPTKLNPSLSRRMERVILRCLAKHPDDRYESAAELHQELAELHDSKRSTSQFGADQAAIEAAVAAYEEEKQGIPMWAKVIAVALIAALLGVISLT